jgi:hypothetical protein
MSLSINDLILSKNIYILARSETWHGSDTDKSVISELLPDCYNIHYLVRQGQKGGGVAIIYNSDLHVKLVKSAKNFTHFELLECTVNSKDHQFQLYVLYRPPPSRVNTFKIVVYFKEWSEFLDMVVVTQMEVLITGDLNFHIDDSNDSDARKFIQTISGYGLQ